MSSTKKIAEAKTTCEGLHRLVRKMNVAAGDLDKNGGSAYELIALLASTHTCVSSLSNQLEALASDTRPGDTASPLDTVTALESLSRHNNNHNNTALAEADPEDAEAFELVEKTYSAQG